MGTCKVYMTPQPGKFKGEASSGIAQVILNWAKYLPEYGIEFVDDQEEADVTIGHVTSNPDADIHVSHGLLWTEEFPLSEYAYEVNAILAEAAMKAKTIIAPSEWVADVYRRDIRADVQVIGHGINPEEWEHDLPNEGYVLYTKNRTSDGLMPNAVNGLAEAFPNVKFLTTFMTKDAPANVKSLGGTVPFSLMKKYIQKASVIFMPDRETWGITAAEAMAAGVPVLSTDAGAVKEFMIHGVSGYTFEHMYLEDAIQGLQYCLDNRDTLSANAKALAKGLHWRFAVMQVAKVIEKVYLAPIMKGPTPGSVDAVITSHNYGHLVGRAIESVLDQRYPIQRVIVVDDSSDDNTKEIVEGFATRKDVRNGERVEYKRVDVQNVALARNAGIYDSNAEYVLVLDGDDWIRSGYTIDCIAQMIDDRRVGFAYSHVEVHLDDGTVLIPPGLENEMEGKPHRQWPTTRFNDQFSYEAGNQIIGSCVIFRREAVIRNGGYRARYAPHGAGTEDANLYLRLLAHGWRGAMPAAKPSNLLVHTHGSGHVSGMKGYEEVDWRAWHPWVLDRRFPFAAMAVPNYKSHPVRSYEPEVSVIIPVGLMHEDSLIVALDSLEAQTFRKWEAIVVFDYTPTKDKQDYYKLAYPFVRFIYPYFNFLGNGPGEARNVGVREARAKYVTFLDADDYYAPNFLEHVNPITSQRHNAVVYSQYFSRMHRDQLAVLGGNVVKEEGDYVVVDNSFRPYDKERALARPEGVKPYVWTGVNVLLPKEWHDSIGGFDETMKSWEDCDYMLRLAWAGYDFYMVESPLWVYSFVLGSRRQDSVDQEFNLMEHMQKAYDDIHAV